MSTPSPIKDEDRADLVAYLDGERDEEAARTLETRITTEPTLRAELEALKRTWELLDYLPKPEPSPNFTNRTLDRITVPEARAARGRRRWVAVRWAAAVLVAG